MVGNGQRTRRAHPHTIYFEQPGIDLGDHQPDRHRFRPHRTEEPTDLLLRCVLQENIRHAHVRSEEHTSELQSRQYLVCRLLLEKKKKTTLHKFSHTITHHTT